MFVVLVVEDDKNTNRLLSDIIKDEGYKVINCFNGVEALNILNQTTVDLVITDVMMPLMDGLTLTKKIQHLNIPILMMSVKNELQDIKNGFISGVDDYMTKPFDNEELLLRIKAILRRREKEFKFIIKINDVILDYNLVKVTKFDKEFKLAKKEFLLLFKLLSNPNRIYDSSELMQEIWPSYTNSLNSTINVHINKIRNKFKDIDDFKIETVRGLGFKGVIKKSI